MEDKVIVKLIWKPRKGVKNYIYKHESGKIIMGTLFLIDINEKCSGEVIATKFNKKLILKISALSPETIQVLNYISTNNLKGVGTIKKAI